MRDEGGTTAITDQVTNPVLEILESRVQVIGWPGSHLIEPAVRAGIRSSALREILAMATGTHTTPYLVGSQANHFLDSPNANAVYDPSSHDIDIQLVDSTSEAGDTHDRLAAYLETLNEIKYGGNQAVTREYNRNVRFFTSGAGRIAGTLHLVIIGNYDEYGKLINIKLIPGYVRENIVRENLTIFEPLVEIGFSPFKGLSSLDFDPTQGKVVVIKEDGFEVIQRDYFPTIGDIAIIAKDRPILGIVMLLRGLKGGIYTIQDINKIMPDFPFEPTAANKRQYQVYVLPKLLEFFKEQDTLLALVNGDEESTSLVFRLVPVFGLFLLQHIRDNLPEGGYIESIDSQFLSSEGVKNSIARIIHYIYKEKYRTQASKIPTLETCIKMLSSSLSHETNLKLVSDQVLP